MSNTDSTHDPLVEESRITLRPAIIRVDASLARQSAHDAGSNILDLVPACARGFPAKLHAAIVVGGILVVCTGSSRRAQRKPGNGVGEGERSATTGEEQQGGYKGGERATWKDKGGGSKRTSLGIDRLRCVDYRIETVVMLASDTPRALPAPRHDTLNPPGIHLWSIGTDGAKLDLVVLERRDDVVCKVEHTLEHLNHQ